MTQTARLGTLVAVLLFAAVSVSEAAIKKVARRYNVLEVYGGYSTPLGKYGQIGELDFVNSRGLYVNIDADWVYEPTFHIGFSYGQIRGGHVFYSVGFRYTRVEVEDTFVVDAGTSWVFGTGEYPVFPTFHQYDVDFNVNFYATNIATRPFSPYVGVGLHGGITSQSAQGFETENWLTLGAGINFGFDLRLYQGPKGRSFVTVSSVNSLDLLASDKKPRYLNVGGGLKYYFRM